MVGTKFGTKNWGGHLRVSFSFSSENRMPFPTESQYIAGMENELTVAARYQERFLKTKPGSPERGVLIEEAKGFAVNSKKHSNGHDWFLAFSDRSEWNTATGEATMVSTNNLPFSGASGKPAK
jgi:hypothetical protein